MSRRVEFVEWVDSSSDGGPWCSPDDLEGPLLPCFSVGYVAREDAVSVTLAQSFHEDKGSVQEWGHALTIPKVAITRREPFLG
jgi:hypothetical protein